MWIQNEQHLVIMFHTKLPCIPSLISVLIFFSCNSGVKELSDLFGKKLSTPRGHLFSGSQLFIFADSTFEYKEGGPALKYTKGRWFIDENKNITLKSYRENTSLNKEFIDTLFMNFDKVIIKRKGKNHVLLNKKLFTLSE